jgi:hypothetical protein
MSLAIEAFTDDVRHFCQWVESDKHDVLTARRLILALVQGIPQLLSSSPSPNDGEEYPRRGHEGWKVDHPRFKDFPFQYYRECFNPFALKEEPVIGDIHDDFADIYGDLWHGLQALERGDGVYAIEQWRESYFMHWGQHATSALYALDQYFRDHRWDLKPENS